MRTEQLQSVVSLTLSALSEIPEPISGAIIGVVKQIWDEVMKTSQNKNQIRLLFSRVCQVLLSLKAPQSYSDSAIQGSVKLLLHNLENVLSFVRSEQQKSFLRTVFTADDLKLKIEEHERVIVTACLAFQNAALLSTSKKLEDLFELLNSQATQKAAREDQQTAYMQDISDRLATMQAAVAYPSFLDALLGTVDADPVHMITAMQTVLEREDKNLGKQEKAFLTAGIERLREQTSFTRKITINSWTVTGLEVERGYLLGTDTTSWVRQGKWRQKLVFILELKDQSIVEKIVKLWEPIRNEHINTFIGASIVDNPPFLLTPYSGTPIINHIETKPDVHFEKLALDIVRGLEYLHNLMPPVVHGGLRPANIFVDDLGSAVLTGVGLANSDFAGSVPEFWRLTEQWLAPELLAHQSDHDTIEPTPASDVYSYGAVLDTLLRSMLDGKIELQETEDVKFMLDLARRCKHSDPSERMKSREISSLLSDRIPDTSRAFFIAQNSRAQSDVVPAADRWRMIRCANSLVESYISGQDVVYLSTPPIGGAGEHPLRKLCFELKCHDQGAARTSASPRDGTWCWVEAAVCRGIDEQDVDLSAEIPSHYRGHMVANTRHEVLRCPFANSTPRVHRITFDEGHPLVRVIQKGDRVKLYPKAMFPGWEIYMYSAEIQVIAEY